MGVTEQTMAGPFKRMKTLSKRWWMGQKDNHFRIVTSLTILSVAATIWGILFLFVLGGTTDQSKEMWVSWSWLGLILGGVGAFWLVPEFLVYLSQKAALDEILLLDSRPEVLRRRKEAEEAADMLGPGYQAHLVRLYNELGIKVSSRFKHVKPTEIVPTEYDSDSSKEQADELSEPWDEIRIDSEPSAAVNFLKTWLNTRNSRLSQILPRAKILTQKEANWVIIGFSLLSSVMLLYNMIFGLATGDNDGAREYSVDLTLMLAGDDSIHSLAPHFDGVSILLTITSLTLLFLTTQTKEFSSSPRKSKTNFEEEE